jgi:hypothetical protein
MFTIRDLGGVSLFLAGTTWLWLTPAFASKGVTTDGAWWSVTRAVCLLTMGAFTVATVGLFARQSWWEVAALGSAAVGLLGLLTYWFAATGAGETVGTAAWNVFVHVLMVAGVGVLLLVPTLEGWVDRHVTG